MKKLLLIIFLLSAFIAKADDIHFYCAPIQLEPAPWDDTATLQAALNLGNVTLTRNYIISAKVTVTYLLHLNGFTISTSQTTDVAIKLGSSGAQVDGGTIAGPWSYLTAGNSAGSAGISMSDNTKVINVTVTQFASYGIVAGHSSNIVVTGCTISKTGFIGFYFDAEIAGTSNGKFMVGLFYID